MSNKDIDPEVLSSIQEEAETAMREHRLVEVSAAAILQLVDEVKRLRSAPSEARLRERIEDVKRKLGNIARSYGHDCAQSRAHHAMVSMLDALDSTAEPEADIDNGTVEDPALEVADELGL